VKAKRIGWGVSALLVGIASAARAEDAGFGDTVVGHFVQGMVGALIYSVLGIIILLIGFKIFDKATPFDLNKEIAEDNNAAAGIAVAGMLIALGVIVAAAISG